MFSDIKRFYYLTRGEKKVFLEAGFLLVSTQTFFSLLPYSLAQKALSRSKKAKSSSSFSSEELIQKVSWSINVLGQRKLIPSKCLSQAFTGKLMLARRGISSQLCIGVKKTELLQGLGVKAHAWLKIEAKVVIGETTDLDEFVELT